jgi:hypothetical protein
MKLFKLKRISRRTIHYMALNVLCQVDFNEVMPLLTILSTPQLKVSRLWTYGKTSEFGAITVSQTRTARISAIARAINSINIPRAVLDMSLVLPIIFWSSTSS